jgi:hypothetical protein
MLRSASPIESEKRILVSGTKAALSVFNNPEILDIHKRKVLTEYLYEFLPSGTPTRHDVPLLHGFTTLRLTVVKKSRRNQLLIVGAYLVSTRDKDLIDKDDALHSSRKTTYLEKFKKAGIVLSIVNAVKKLYEFFSGGSPH